MTLDPRKDGLKLLELRLGIEVVKTKEKMQLWWTFLNRQTSSFGLRAQLYCFR
jgi:hypothetical protein